MASKQARSLASVYTPFLRRFTDERALELADTIALYRSVRASWRASRWADADAVERVSNQLASDVIDHAGLPESRALCEALDRCQREVIALETTIFSCPDINWDRANLSLKEQIDLRRFLRAQEHFLANEERVAGLFEAQLFSLFCGLTREFPPLPEDDGAFSIPLLSLVSDPGLRQTVDGTGQVDLLLTKGKLRIACEITVTTGKEWELGNVKKCLAAGYDAVILVGAEERHLKSLGKFVADQLDDRERRRVRYLTPEGVISYLDELDIGAETTEETVRGYKVKVSRAAVDPEEMKTRREAIAKVLAKSMKKPKGSSEPSTEHQE